MLLSSLKSLEKVKRSYVNLVRFPRYLWADLDECESVLDLGCAKGNLVKIAPTGNRIRYMGLDVYRPYLAEFARTNYAGNISTDWIQGDASHVPFTSRSFAAVVALELLEHLDKNVALQVVSEMERIAKRKVVITVPNGFVKQSAYEGNEFQTHRSTHAADM
jgi:SAM-dependent methyltransferase